MNHDYMDNPNKPGKCIECAYPEEKHGDNAPCDCCDKTGNLQIWMLNNQQALLTRECLAREKAVMLAEINSPEGKARIDAYQNPQRQQERLDAYVAVAYPYDKLINESRKIDEHLHLSSDIFTARITSIADIKKAIFDNPDIPADKKFFEFVAECKRRMNHLQTVIFDLDKQKMEAYSEQKAWHISMNDYANKLRTEERQQLKIQDVTYDVKVPKPVTPKAISTNKKAVPKAELRNAVNKLNAELVGTGKDGLSEFTVQMVMVAKNWTLEQTINNFRRQFMEGKSE